MSPAGCGGEQGWGVHRRAEALAVGLGRAMLGSGARVQTAEGAPPAAGLLRCPTHTPVSGCPLVVPLTRELGRGIELCTQLCASPSVNIQACLLPPVGGI